MSDANILTSENIISLKTAIFRDDGCVGTLHLTPRFYSYTGKVAWIFRRRLPCVERFKHIFLNWNRPQVERYLRPENIPKGPRVDFIWSENGESVAVLVDGNPMAFIHETVERGFSKCLTDQIAGNFWDENLYRKTFL